MGICAIIEIPNYVSEFQLNKTKDSGKKQMDSSIIQNVRSAINIPTQNPIEDIWLQAKQWIRECYHLGQTFAAVKYMFKLVTHYQIFDFPKLHIYGQFSQIR